MNTLPLWYAVPSPYVIGDYATPLLCMARATPSKARVCFADDEIVYHTCIDVPPGLDPKLVRQAISDTLSSPPCYHEHDCCGCTFTLCYRHEITRIRRNRYRAVIHVRSNT